MRILLLCLLLAGCSAQVQPNIASGNDPLSRNTVSAESPITQAAGDQSGKMNLSNIHVDGLTLGLVAMVAVLVFGWLLSRGNNFKTLTDMLISHNEKINMDEMEKLRLSANASDRGVAKLLRSRVDAVRKKVQKS